MELAPELKGDNPSTESTQVNDLDQRWDKLKEWSEVKNNIQLVLQDPETFDHSITLEHGPQLFQTMRHCCNIRCSTHFKTKTGEMFVSHYSRGTVSYVCAWTLNSSDPDAACIQDKSEVCYTMCRLMFVPKYRVFVGFSPDMKLRVFTKSKNGCQEVSHGISATTVLCLAFNRDTNEVITGCIGAVEAWALKGSEHAAVMTKVRRFALSVTKDDWVLDIQVDTKNKQLLVVCETALMVLNYEKNQQTHYMSNKHSGSMKCCCVYNQGEYLITGSLDGSIKVWNAVVFTQVHAFTGHRGAITAMQPHRVDPLLFSSSMDGSVQIWRMDNFQRFMRLDLGEPIFSMKLLGETRLFCQLEKEIKLYNLNQFFSLFAPVESTVHILQCIPGLRGKPSRILASCQDGSVRFFSPVNGLTITIVYPMPTFQVLRNFVYNVMDDLLYTLLLGGEVLVLGCSSNPCRAVRILSPEAEPSEVLDLALVNVTICGIVEALVFGGLRNGQICLLDARHYHMPMSTQAHHGRILCLEACPNIAHNALGLDRNHAYVLSGGTDYLVRLWRVSIFDRQADIIRLSMVHQFEFSSSPTKLVLSLDRLCATFTTNSSSLRMYQIKRSVSRQQVNTSLHLVPKYHSSDYDHTAEISTIDQCPAVQIFATASSDGSVKIWDFENNLIRELFFGKPLSGICFANRRGDILIGFENHVVSVSILNYLPLDKLEHVAGLKFQDDKRESPLTYNHLAKPWFDPRSMARDYLQLEKRLMHGQQARTADGSVDSGTVDQVVQIVLGEGGRFQMVDGAMRIVMTEDSKFAEEITKKIILQRQSQVVRTTRCRRGALAVFATVVMDARRNRLIRIGEVMDAEEEEEEGEEEVEEDEGIGEELEQEAKVIQVYDPFLGLTALERELLERKPIIAPDGYIPNSVIRKILGHGRAIKQRTPSPWKPRPVPKVDPRHLPPGWEERLRAYEEEMEEDNQGSVSSVESGKPFLWAEDEDEEGELKSSPSPTFTSSPVPSLTSHATKLHTKPAVAADSYKHTYKPTSHGITKVDWNFDKSQGREKSEKPSVKVVPEVLAAPEVVKQKTFRRQVSQVEKIQTPTKPGDTDKKEDTPKRKTRKSTAGVDIDLLQRLQAEDWFPSDTPLEVSAAVQKLLEMLSSFGRTPAIHHKICDYIISLQEQTGMIKPTVQKFQERLLDQLTCEMNEIRSNCVRTLRDLGMDSNDITTAILPKLVDPSREVRQEAVLALVELTNVKDKESLADLLNKLGITRPLLSSEDEDNALKILRDKIGLTKQQSVTVIESFHDWVSDWVSSSIPGVFEGEEYIPVMASEEEAGTVKRVKIVSPDSEGRDSSLERKRRNSTSSQRRKSFSKRRPSRSVKPGGKSSSVLEEKEPEITEEPKQTAQKSRQGRQPTKVLDQLSGGRGPQRTHSPHSYIRNTPEPEAFSHDQKPRGSWTSETAVLLRVESRFRPKGGSGNSHPEPLTEGSGQSRDPTDSGRATHRGEGHSGKRDTGQVLSKRLIEYARMSSDKDSDLHSLSMSAGSDHQDVVIPTEISQQTEVHSQEGLSLYDSGIGRDISDSSSQGNRVGPVASYKKKVNQRQLSPVKSSSNGPSPPPKRGKDWKEFFETPTAVERRRMGMVKKDFEEGNMKKMSSLPPISYISSDLPTSPGEAGLRLLHTVRVAEKDKSDSEKHKVEAVPGRLSVHTQNVDSGRSNFGVLQMQWTTNVPVVPVSGGRQQRKKSSHMTRSYNPDLTLPPLDKSGNILSKPHMTHMDETRFPMVQSMVESDYVWEKPLPPPPITKSRTVISPVRKMAHDHMCRHYKLAKKKLHHYISSKSPSQFRYEAKRSSVHDLHHPSLNKSKYVRHGTLPPLQLGMLMDCIRVDA